MDVNKEEIHSAMKELMLPERKGIMEDNRDIITPLDLTNKRLDDMNAHLVNLRRRIDDARTELNSRIDKTRAELKAEIQKITERIDKTNKRIDETRAELTSRIDQTRVELKTEIQKNTQRIDYTNIRIDTLTREIAEVRGDLIKALSYRVVIENLNERVGRLETRAV